MAMLSEKQAYAAMLLFLDRFNRNTKSEGEIGSLISGMHFVAEVETFDPAYWDEWLEDVQKVLAASATEEGWQRFEEKYLAYEVMAPDGTRLRVRAEG
jgi:hypothetical protein